MVTLEVLGPYTVTTHIRDPIVFEHPRGAAAQWVAPGEGSIDFRRFVARFAELCPNSAMQLKTSLAGRRVSFPYTTALKSQQICRRPLAKLTANSIGWHNS